MGMKLSAYVLVHASIYLLHRRPLLRVDIPAAREEFLVRVRIRVRVRVRARIRARARVRVRGAECTAGCRRCPEGTAPHRA